MDQDIRGSMDQDIRGKVYGLRHYEEGMDQDIRGKVWIKALGGRYGSGH